jgi:hypothetical protein
VDLPEAVGPESTTKRPLLLDIGDLFLELTGV